MQRVNALRENAFEKRGFDGFLIFNPANLLYFTGFQGAAVLFIPRDGECTMYVYGVNYEQAKAEATNFTVERMKPNENLFAKIAEKAVDCKVKRLAMDALNVESWRRLSKMTKSRIKLSCKSELVAELRKVKDAKEIELMRKAAELTQLGMKVACEILSPGKREFEVAAEIEYAMRKRGSCGTAFDTAVSSGQRSAYPHGGCTGRQIREGDLVVLDFGAIYADYRSDMTRTLVAGTPSEKQKRIFDVVKKAQQTAFEATKAKAKTRDVDAKARKVIEEAGYDEFFVHGLGHGVGLEIHEPPTLNSASKEILQAGNVVTLEPAVYLPGYGGVRFEDTVLVGRKGAEKLTAGFDSLTAKG